MKSKQILAWMALFAALSIPPLRADPVGVPVQVWLNSSIVRTDGECTLSAPDTLESYPGAADGGFLIDMLPGNRTGNFNSDLTIVRLEPGKAYVFSVWGSYTPLAELNITAPPGYQVNIDRVPRTAELIYLSGGQSSSYDYTVQIFPDNAQVGGLAGETSSLADNRIAWLLSMGGLKNGQSAGALSLVDAGTGTDWSKFFTPAGLSYETPAPEITVKHDPNVPANIRQIVTNQAYIDIVTSAIDATLTATQYEIYFYHPSRLSNSQFPYTFSGSPFVKYRVEQGSTATSLQITKFVYNDAGTQTRKAVTTLVRSGNAPNYTWTVQDWTTVGKTALVERVRTSTGSPSKGTAVSRTESFQIRAPGGAAVVQATLGFAGASWGETAVATSVGSSTPANSSFASYDGTSTQYNNGFTKSAVLPGGRWEAYDYGNIQGLTLPAYSNGRPRHIFRPFNGLPATVPTTLDPGQGGEVTTIAYSLDAFGTLTRPSSIQKTINGTTVANVAITYTTAQYAPSDDTLWVVTATRQEHNYNQAVPGDETLTSITKYFREDAGAFGNSQGIYRPEETFYRNLPYSVQAPDEVKTVFAYQSGDFTPQTATVAASFTVSNLGQATRTAVITGTSNTSAGDLLTDYNGFVLDPVYAVNGKSTMTVTIRDAQALIRRMESYVWTSAVIDNTNAANNVPARWNLLTWINFTYDGAGHLIQRDANNGGRYTASYSTYGDLKDSEQDETGVKLTYTYDDAGRVWQISKTNGPVTTLTYDAAGNLLSRAVTGGGETITDASLFDDAGRLAHLTPAGLGTSDISYAYTTSGWSQTVTAPDKGTTTKSYQLDGRLRSITGTAVIGEYLSYEVNSNGLFKNQVNLGSSGSPRYKQTWTDWLGRIDHTLNRGFTKGSQPQPDYVEQHFYEAVTGHLAKTTRTGYTAPLLYEYDPLGEVSRAGLKMSGSGKLQTASTDRIMDSNQTYQQDSSGAWWLRQESVIYPFPNNVGTPVTAQLQRVRLTGFSGSTQAEAELTDIEGNKTDTTVSVDRSSATVTSSSTHSGMLNSRAEVSVNGLVSQVTEFDNLTVGLQYDALERLWIKTDPRNQNTTTLAYYSGTGLPYTVTDATKNIILTNTYDGNGRLQTSQNAAGKLSRYAYSPLGQLTSQWGAAEYPLAYGYDSVYGDRTSLSTYQNATNTDAVKWSDVVLGTANQTQWAFDDASGLLWQKKDADSHTVSFDYNSRGQVATRTWARTVTSTYGYDGATGELTATTYSDSTPTLLFTYTRLGQRLTASDATGKRTFNYDANLPWRLANEALPAFYHNRYLSRLYDSTANSNSGTLDAYTTATIAGRPSGFALGASAGASGDLLQSQTYSNLGRFIGVTTQAGSSPGQAFIYNYTPSSALLAGYTSGPNFSMALGYETSRDLVTQVKSTWASAPVTQFDYTYDGLARRQTATISGSAYADYYSGINAYNSVFNHYLYNDRGELQTSAMYRGSSSLASPAAADELPGRRFEYRYDTIGNRQTAGDSGLGLTNGGTDDSYKVNNLNQYYPTKENNRVRVLGTVSASANVTVNGASPTRKLDRVWGASLPPGNNQPVLGSAKVSAVAPPVAGSPDLVRTDSKPFFIPAATQSLTYDADGNLLTDGVWLYSYDAENQLVQMDSTLSAGYTGMFVTIKFTYDYLGRRVEKAVVNKLDGTTSWDRRFLYDGWNLVAELDSAGANLIRSYTWGLDLAGSLTATGGVGALLQIYDHGSSKSYWPTYDGNGNVAALVNGSNGSVAAAYEYDPFGNYLRADVLDPVVKDSPWRFSTMYTDVETKLVYYGLRYYSPPLGRFINKDPIEEFGGVNLYAFARNDGINKVDLLGMGANDPSPDQSYTFPPYVVTGTFIPGGSGGGVLGGGGMSGGHSVGPTQRQAPGGMVIKNMFSNPDPFNKGHFTYLGDGTWVENVNGDAGWLGRDVMLADFPVNASRVDDTNYGWNGTSGRLEVGAPAFRLPNFQVNETRPHHGVGQPGMVESLIPIWGSGRQAIDHFQNGRWIWGTIDTAIAITDVILVKTLVTAGMKVLIAVAIKDTEKAAEKAVEKAAENLPALRSAYVAEVRALEDVGLAARSAGQDAQATARMLHEMRRDLGVQYKNLTPAAELDKIYLRNIDKYGDKLGPTIDYLRGQGKTWEQIIESASRPGGKDLGL